MTLYDMASCHTAQSVMVSLLLCGYGTGVYDDQCTIHRHNAKCLVRNETQHSRWELVLVSVRVLGMGIYVLVKV